MDDDVDGDDEEEEEDRSGLKYSHKRERGR